MCVISCGPSNQMVELDFQDPLLQRVNRGRNTFSPPTLLDIEESQDRFLLWLEHFKFDAKKIDVFSRVVFPSAFTLFNAVYWTYYLNIHQINQTEQ